MDLKADVEIAFPREQVFAAYRDHLPDLVQYLPNVASIERRDRREEGPLTHLVLEWKAKSEIPAAVRKFFGEEMLAWTDRAEYDAAGWMCRWRIETHAMPGLVECRGTTTYEQLGGARTRVRIAADLSLHLERAHIPKLLHGAVRGPLEKLVVHNIAPNLVATGEAVGKYLAAGRAG